MDSGISSVGTRVLDGTLGTCARDADVHSADEFSAGLKPVGYEVAIWKRTEGYGEFNYLIAAIFLVV